MKNLLSELLGWYGLIVVLLGYFLVSFSILKAESVPYQLLNVTGATGLTVVSLAKRAYQLTIVNVVWGTIGLIALVKMLL